jgi:hypothetical protein
MIVEHLCAHGLLQWRLFWFLSLDSSLAKGKHLYAVVVTMVEFIY